MKIIYEAFDGTQFDNEFDCEDYEWKLNHKESLKDLIFYDKDEKVMTDSKLSEDVYSKVMKIEVLSNYGVQALKDIADYTGFCCYDVINSTGVWTWSKENEKFEKISENIKYFNLGIDI